VNRLRGRRRLLLATIVALVGAGVAGGIALARGDTGRAPGKAGVLARGKFRTVSWGTTGHAIVERTASGRLVLRFDEAFGTRDAPDLYVYLDQQDPRTHHGKRGKSLLVGSLANHQGGQHYELPARASSMTGYLVEIYCGECNKTNAFAQLRPAAQS
jgi:Electron transfer DM13